MNEKTVIKAEFIAPCGMNCALCMARLLRKEDQCPGCRGNDKEKPKSCVQCTIVNCGYLKETGSKYCSTGCEKYPCRRLRNLDKRYRNKYHMSMIENLEYIEEKGIRAFVRNEKIRWTCPECGGIICVHRDCCSGCGRKVF
ncbi:MAG: DUF3795 domain-containing protein [Actinobacteria bacterium]|nr:DUF3795 domain-containing protein [Actinomycetota bacterium]